MHYITFVIWRYSVKGKVQNIIFLDKIEFVIYNGNRVKGKRKEAVAKLTERTIHGNKIGDGAEGTFEF